MGDPGYMFSHGSSRRIKITLADGKILHNGNPCRVDFSHDTISVGCTDVSREVFEYLVKQYNKILETLPLKD